MELAGGGSGGEDKENYGDYLPAGASAVRYIFSRRVNSLLIRIVFVDTFLI